MLSYCEGMKTDRNFCFNIFFGGYGTGFLGGYGTGSGKAGIGSEIWISGHTGRQVRIKR
jgi:hypothetical protein